MPQLPMVTLVISILWSSVVCPTNLQRPIQGHGELGGVSSTYNFVQANNQVVSSRSKQVE